MTLDEIIIETIVGAECWSSYCCYVHALFVWYIELQWIQLQSQLQLQLVTASAFCYVISLQIAYSMS